MPLESAREMVLRAGRTDVAGRWCGGADGTPTDHTGPHPSHPRGHDLGHGTAPNRRTDRTASDSTLPTSLHANDGARGHRTRAPDARVEGARGWARLRGRGHRLRLDGDPAEPDLLRDLGRDDVEG